MSEYIFGWDGDNGMGLKLIDDIIAGRKTATSSYKRYFDINRNEETPWDRLGKVIAVKDKYGKTHCSVKVERVYLWSLDEPPAQLVKEENFGTDTEAYVNDCLDMWKTDMPEDVQIKPDEKLIAEEFVLMK